eukprot:1102695-Rhodomonas_salina.1
MVHQFGVAPSVVAALESRYQIRKKKGSDLVVSPLPSKTTFQVNNKSTTCQVNHLSSQQPFKSTSISPSSTFLILHVKRMGGASD